MTTFTRAAGSLIVFACFPALAAAQATITPATTGGGGGGGSVTGGACGTNLVAVSNNSQAVPSCVTVTSAYVNNTIALTGVDINTSSQVTALHMAAPVTVAMGGTGLASYAVGDVLYASAGTTIAKLADVATGNVLLSGGVTTAPAYGKVGLTTHVSGILPTANGGTNNAFVNISGPATTAKTYTLPNASSTILTDNAAVTVAQGGTGVSAGFTAHGTIVGNGTSPMGVVAPGSAGTVLTSNGAGADPTYQAVSGTGTVTSLATTGPITGGTITTSGTIACATCTTSAAALTAHGPLVGQGSQTMAAAAVGTSGWVFTSNGASADPTMQPPGTTVTETSVTGSVTISTYGGAYQVNCSTACTLILPTPASHAGQSQAIRVASTSNLVTLDGNGALIDGAATRIMHGGESANLVIDIAGTYYQKVSGSTIPLICVMHNSAAQTITGSTSTATKVNLDTTDIDNSGLMADTTNHTCVVKRPGIYEVGGQSGWGQLPVTQAVLGFTGKNGNGVPNRLGSQEMAQSEAAGVFLKFNFQRTVPLAVADTLELDSLIYVTHDLQAEQNVLSVREIISW